MFAAVPMVCDICFGIYPYLFYLVIVGVIVILKIKQQNDKTTKQLAKLYDYLAGKTKSRQKLAPIFAFAKAVLDYQKKRYLPLHPHFPNLKIKTTHDVVWRTQGVDLKRKTINYG